MQLIRLLKDWTLPVAIGTGCVVYIIFALVPQLDGFATAAAPVFMLCCRCLCSSCYSSRSARSTFVSYAP